MNARVLVAADAHPQAGLGHLSRAGAVAAALSARGVAVDCVALGAEGPIGRDGIDWDPSSGEGLAALAEGFMAAVVDSYAVGEEHLAAIASEARLVVFDDRGDAAPSAALVIRPGSTGAASPTILAGLDYTPLRPPFSDPPPREIAERVTTVLVAMGSGDTNQLGPRVVRELAEALPGVGTVGPGEDMLRVMLAADLMISAGGQTLLEACATGLPSVTLALADNQRAQLDALSSLGAVLVVASDPGSLAEAARALASDYNARAELSARARQAVDGRGASRVAEAIEALLTAPAERR